MTIKELYEWAVRNRVEDYDIKIQYRDSGGYYTGTDILYESEIEINDAYTEIIL